VSHLFSTDHGSASFLKYSPSDASWTFADPFPSRGRILLRNAVVHGGEVAEVVSVSYWALAACAMSAILISRNVGSLGRYCMVECQFLEIVAFEGDSDLWTYCQGHFVTAARCNRSRFHGRFTVCGRVASLVVILFGRWSLNCRLGSPRSMVWRFVTVNR
jgi:hypothetical protein